METEKLKRLIAAKTEKEREAIVLEMSLSVLSLELREAVKAAAVPHWFNALFLETLIGAESDVLYAQLLGLSFVEQAPGKGYTVHERTRRLILRALWQSEPERFQMLSGRAADYCQRQALRSDDPIWEAEAIYHLLVSDPDAGVNGLRGLATKWANYKYHTYDEIERAVRWANEQIEAERLDGAGAEWTRLWQAKLALIYGRPDLAANPLEQIDVDPVTDLTLAAEVAQTRGDVLANGEDHVGMAAAWRNAYDLYRGLEDGSGLLDAYLVAEKMRQHNLPTPEPVTVADETAKTPPFREALRLIDNITAAWIDGVLKTTLAETIDLRMMRTRGHLPNLVYHRPQRIDHRVAAGQRLGRLFDTADRSLLILGAPGSGKTITLLQLLDELLQEARMDRDAPIPLLFNLSSFGLYLQEKDEVELAGWLAEQAYDQYRLKQQTTRERLAAGDRFVLLLDGLDEVKAERREQCVAAINQFVQTYPCGLVVCSRIGDYEALQNRLALDYALVLQPLVDRQIETFIEQVGGAQEAAMQRRIQDDWRLREALRSPLLLNLFPRAFAFLPSVPRESALSSESTVDARRQALFASYVESVFASQDQGAKAEIGSVGSKGKSQYWLSFLANRMRQTGKSMFFVEEMQPAWLPQHLIHRYRGLYGLIFGAIVGVIVGTIGIINDTIPIVAEVDRLLGSLSENILSVPMFVLIGGLITAAIVAVTTWITFRVRQLRLRAVIGGIIFWVFIGLILGLLVEPSEGFLGGLLYGLSFTLLLGQGLFISIGMANLLHEIRLRERVRFLMPNWQRTHQYIKQGAFYGLLAGLGGGFIYELSGWLTNWRWHGQIGGMQYGLVFGLLFGLSGSLLVFLDTPPVDERPIPGGGVRASIRNALLMTTLTAILFSLLPWFINQRSATLIVVLINVLPPTFTWFGGLAWCQHWALRVILIRQGWLPLRLVPWLDEMATRGLLRRVGGGYIFLHRSLLEYFAGLEDW